MIQESHLWINIWENWSQVLEEMYVYFHVHAVLFTETKIQKQPAGPLTDEWIIKKKKRCYIHAMECLSSLKKKEILLYVIT